MKLLKQSAVLFIMVLIGACDENMKGDIDASVPESCVLYAAPGADVDAGTGESETSPLVSVESVVSKASALKSHCGDAAEVRFADGSLSNEQLGIATEALKSTGIKVGKYYGNINNKIASSTSNTDIGEKGTATVLGNTGSLSDKLSEFEGSLGMQSSFTPRSGSSPWWEESGTSNNIFYSTGNVAIGSSASATSKLQILGSDSSPSSGGALPTGALRVESSNNQFMFFDGNEIDSYAKTSPYGAATIFLNGNSVGKIVMRTTLSANSAVEMSGYENGGTGADSGILRLYKDTTTSTAMIMDNNEIDSYDTAGLHLNNNSSQAVYIAGNTGKSNYVYIARGDGNVAIGNLTSAQTTHKLTVNGGIKATEIVVDTVGADFVFEDNYNLMSLDEVESFVKKNNHLPGVASAKSMQKDGLEMGEFQIKLLQKVEELTLYTIEQKNQIRRLEAALNNAGIKMTGGNK